MSVEVEDRAAGAAAAWEAVADTTVEPLLDAKGAAALLNVPATWVLAEARADRIPHVRLGRYARFDAAELHVWWLERVSRRTAQKTLVLLYGMLEYAKRRRWIIDNPAEDAERVTVKRRTEFAVLSP